MNELQRIRYEIRGDSLVIRFIDRKLVDSHNIEAMGNQLIALVPLIEQNSVQRVVLYFDGVNFFSSSALNEFLLFHKEMRRANLELHCRGLTPEIREVFRITRLNRLFHIEGDDFSGPQDLQGSEVPKPDRPSPGSLGAAKNLGEDEE